MKLSEIGERGLIRFLSHEFTIDHPRVVEGVGDDASVILQDEKKCLLATTDVLIEGIHFSHSYTEPYLLGKKAVSTSLSDIAAMGGAPTFLLLSLSLPPETSMEYLHAFYRGVRKRMDEFGVVLIGGNTSSSHEGMTIGVVVLGEVPRDEVVCRKGASPGDLLYVTGQVGDAALGLELLKTAAMESEKIAQNRAVMRHLDPTPRSRVGRLIAERRLATAMIDISDGLLRDLHHLTEASGCGATLSLPRLPLSSQVRDRITSNPDDIRLPLAGGEDYELLFSASPKKTRSIQSLAGEAELPITSIGSIVPKEKGVVVVDKDGELVPIRDKGYDHFVDL
ncbi:MAG: thiamine-phosphate kinase [Thermodesulfobacteriota bacterium]